MSEKERAERIAKSLAKLVTSSTDVENYHRLEKGELSDYVISEAELKIMKRGILDGVKARNK